MQKLINEREVAENMANLGLTDSGLNRTQQTAVQLSAANNSAKIQRQKQSYYQALERELTAKLADIETSRLSSEAQLRLNYNDKVASLAGTWRQADIDAETERQKEYYKYLEKQSKAAADEFVLQKWYGETNDDGLLKFIGSDGKSKYVTPGKNPYTNSINAKIASVENGKCIIDKKWQEANKNSSNAMHRATANYGVFSNGYQPKGVMYYDDNGKIIDAGSLTATTRKDYVNGNQQTVWYAKKTNTYWIWNGDANEYMLYQM